MVAALSSSHLAGRILAAPGSDHRGLWQGHAASSGPLGPLFSPEVRVPGGISGYLDLDGTGVLQANDLGECGEGTMQPGCGGALRAQAWLEEGLSFP